MNLPRKSLAKPLPHGCLPASTSCQDLGGSCQCSAQLYAKWTQPSIPGRAVCWPLLPSCLLQASVSPGTKPVHRMLGSDFGDGRAGRPTSCAVRAGGAVVVVVVGRQNFRAARREGRARVCLLSCPGPGLPPLRSHLKFFTAEWETGRCPEASTPAPGGATFLTQPPELEPRCPGGLSE